MAILLTSELREQAGSCNFCQRGRPGPGGASMVFPYTHVAVLGSDLARGTGSMRLCPECLAALSQQLASFALPDPGHDADTART